MRAAEQRSPGRSAVIVLAAMSLLLYPLSFSVWRALGPASREWDVEGSVMDLNGNYHEVYFLEVTCDTIADRGLATAFYPALRLEAWLRGDGLIIWKERSSPVVVPEWWP
ncbi:MAG: hypothetical protein ACYTFI_07105 [Planctomycetota bacterium]